MLAFIGYAYSKKIGLVMTLIALAVGVARVLAHVHSWIDIFGGVIIAAVSAILAIYISYYITQKWLSRSYVRIVK
jgi:membrane-associated phospholipid phosphatase